VADCQNFDALGRWIVAIGASGSQGLDDVKELLGELPTTVAAVIMVVLHRSWHHSSDLHAILTDATVRTRMVELLIVCGLVEERYMPPRDSKGE
jgi:hypothetical protein